jgi:hypothetical protein
MLSGNSWTNQRLDLDVFRTLKPFRDRQFLTHSGLKRRRRRLSTGGPGGWLCYRCDAIPVWLSAAKEAANVEAPY